MKRWAMERDLMMRRWRQELATHGTHAEGSKWYWGMPTERLAPPSLACNVACHCANGIGTMRNQRPYGCPTVRCGLCHPHKKWPKRTKRRERKDAIAKDLAAW